MSKPILDEYGDTRWFNSKGEYHRLEGPAYEGADGAKEWYVDGKLHRLDGPAIDLIDGNKRWFVEGIRVTASEYPAAVLLYKCKQVLESC